MEVLWYKRAMAWSMSLNGLGKGGVHRELTFIQNELYSLFSTRS